MDKMQEKRIGQEMLAFEKAQICAGLRGPLPDYTRKIKSKPCADIKRLCRVLDRSGPLDMSALVDELKLPLGKARGLVFKALRIGTVRKIAGPQYRTFLYEVACDE